MKVTISTKDENKGKVVYRKGLEYKLQLVDGIEESIKLNLGISD